MQGFGNKMMINEITKEPLIEFKPKLPKLSKNESKVLQFLVEAGRLVTPLYQLQENKQFLGANFYPPDATKEEIQKAAEQEPLLLSPYTVIERIDGKLVAIPYHIKYKDLLKPIAAKLDQASGLTDSKEFSRLLKLQAKALLDGSYEDAISASIKTEAYVLDIYIGPLNYFSRIFAGKAAYQAWVGVLDIEGTKRLNSYKKVVFNASRKALGANYRVENFDNVKAKTIDEVLLSGLMARSRFVGLSLPMDTDWIEKYGSEVTIFNQANNLRLEKQIIPTFNNIFSPAFKEGFSSEDLRRASLRYVALHELAHNYLYYKDSAKNLQNLYPVIYELTATLLGMRIAGSLLLKDRITSKQLESMIVAFVSRSFDLIKKSKENKFMINYALGGAIFINFMLESGAIKQKGGIAITNFAKIFLSLHELSYMLERLLSSGTKEDAEVLIEKYGQVDNIF